MNMKYFALGAIVSLVNLASARHCQNITVPVTISSINGVYNVKTPRSNIDVENFILDLTQLGVNYPKNVQTGNRTVSGTYKIAATLCNPDKGQSETVQLLTHGIGFDRSYWDIPYNNYNYSYINVAEKYGYSTFTWDRLGIGMSQHLEPIQESQAGLEVEALHALTVLLRQGKISGCEKAFKKVVHVGHSFGSDHTYALTAKYPHDSDGIALTGFSQNASGVAYFAQGGNFIQANKNPALASYADGYFAASDETAVQNNFFAPGQFSAGVLTYATKTGQPVTVGELLTMGSETTNTNNFAGPTLVITGARDVPFCAGNCLLPSDGYPNIPAAAQKKFPNAKNFQAVVVPKSGHGLNLEYSHPFTYKTINEYFVNNGVAAN